MRSDRLALLLAFCLGLAAVTVSAQTIATTPREIVAAIYDREAAALKDQQVETPFVSKQMRARYFSKGFDRLIRQGEAEAAREQGVGPVDFDPVLSGQDGELKSLTIETVRVASHRTVVAAKFSSFEQPTTVTYDLVEDGRAWKIDDIEGMLDKTPWSVRRILEAARPRRP